MATLNKSTCTSLMQGAKYTDFEITCHGISFKAHKFMLAVSSKFFEIMLKHQWKETVDGTIDFPKDDPFVIAHVLDFIYLGVYGVDKPKIAYTESNHSTESRKDTASWMGPRTTTVQQLEHHVSMYLAGDKFYLEKLKSMAQRSVTAALQDKDIEKVNGGVGGALEPLFSSGVVSEEFRLEVLELCAEKSYLRDDKSVRTILNKHEQLAWTLAKKHSRCSQVLHRKRYSSDVSSSSSSDSSSHFSDSEGN